MVTPTATYRLHLTPDFGFDAAIERLDVVRALGVSHLYLSPIAQAVPTSSHGYDVTDHTTVRREFGGDAGLARLLDAAADRGMGVIVDHVPNHTSVEFAHLNDPWWTMLRNGPESTAARWFDVEWDHSDGRVIIPRLGEPLDDVLASGGIEMGEGDRGPELRYGPLRFPLAPGTEELDVRDAVHAQHYRLAWWRVPTRNVRRFFTIDDLVGVRVEHADVADAVDTIPRRLTEHAAFAGVRIDHVDGLADPTGYLRRLRGLLGEDRVLLVEKILGPGEQLPADWPVDGTTGYEHITAIEHALLDPSAGAPLMASWSDRVGTDGFEELDHVARLEVIDGGLSPDVDRVVRGVVAAASDDDVDAVAVRAAMVDVTMQLDRYRTYLPDDPASAEVLRNAVAGAAHDRAVLIGDVLAEPGSAQTRWQQLTGPVMAKGAEDRAFYRWFPLASLSEVGGEPAHFSTPIAAFHDAQRNRQRTMPTGMLAATTHDTKRSSGVRARSLALAAASTEWVELVDEWIDAHHGLATRCDPSLLLLALQTAVTARPLTADRLGDYLVKAAREADLVTSWIEPDDAVEDALRDLATVLVGETDVADSALASFATGIERRGAEVDLALLAIQLTCPGFADLYQGSPMGLFSLVDPDNRRPPDWERLERLVESSSATSPVEAWTNGQVDAARVALTRNTLEMRTESPDAFGPDAGYVELDVSGPGSDHVLAYGRADDAGAALVVVTRRLLAEPLDERAVAIELPAGIWLSLMDPARERPGGQIALADLLDDAPVAVLRRR